MLQHNSSNTLRRNMNKKRQVMFCKADCRARAFVVLPRVAAFVFAIAIATNNIR